MITKGEINALKKKFKYYEFTEADREAGWQDTFCYIWEEDEIYIMIDEDKCFNGHYYGTDIDNLQDLIEVMPPILQKRRDDRIDEILS